MPRTKRLTIQSYKGGTGKTYFCANLATFLSEERKKRVLLIDSDWNAGTICRYFVPEKIIGTMRTYNDFIIWLDTNYKDSYENETSPYDLTDISFVNSLSFI